jgi:hypothetical protein
LKPPGVHELLSVLGRVDDLGHRRPIAVHDIECADVAKELIIWVCVIVSVPGVVADLLRL